MIPRDTGETENNEAGTAEIEDIDMLKRMLDEQKDKADKYLANWQRTQADFANFKRRSEQEKEELSQYANSTLLLCLLPILDDFDRALSSIPADSATSWVEGVKLIQRKLTSTLESLGISTIKAVGEPFDPRLHEAIRQAKGKEGIVIEEVQKGYQFGDRVIQPSKVVVGNGEEETQD